ncbi:hypothetical protein B0A49_13444, partial [Cryomyces minteri]
KLRNMLDGSSFPFTISIDDPAGNSWIEPSPRDHAGKYTRREYLRTREQNEALGLEDGKAQRDGTGAPDTEIRPEYKATQMTPAMPDGGVNNVDADDEIVENRVYSFPATCPGCMKPCDTNMKMVNIPHFKQVVVMSTVCDHCGYRSNEIKTGGEIPEKGCRITMSVERPEDLARDILKSESCRLICPGLELDVQPGTVGGRFTTIEEKLSAVHTDQKHLEQKNHELVTAYEEKSRSQQQIQKLYQSLKSQVMASHVQTAASDDAENTLQTVTGSRLIDRLGTSRAPQSQYAQFSAGHRGAEQIHSRQRSSGSGGITAQYSGPAG